MVPTSHSPSQVVDLLIEGLVVPQLFPRIRVPLSKTPNCHLCVSVCALMNERLILGIFDKSTTAHVSNVLSPCWIFFVYH